MRRSILLLLVFVCAFSGYAQTIEKKQFTSNRKNAAVRINPSTPTASRNSSISSLPIRRVILYSNGVAYFERRGIVTGNAEIDLSFKQSQVDDVLKSMVVLDLGQGRIGAVSYNSSQPASARTAEIPFSIDSTSEGTDGQTGGLAGVLAQLQGAKVVVTSLKGTATGSILTVEKKTITRKKENEETFLQDGRTLVIASDGGDIASF